MKALSCNYLIRWWLFVWNITRYSYSTNQQSYKLLSNVKLYLQIALPEWSSIQFAPGPQGDGSQGSGFSTQKLFSHTKPRCLQSGSLVHSGPHPVIVSGLGTNPC